MNMGPVKPELCLVALLTLGSWETSCLSEGVKIVSACKTSLLRHLRRRFGITAASPPHTPHNPTPTPGPRTLATPQGLFEDLKWMPYFTHCCATTAGIFRRYPDRPRRYRSAPPHRLMLHILVQHLIMNNPLPFSRECIYGMCVMLLIYTSGTSADWEVFAGGEMSQVSALKMSHTRTLSFRDFPSVITLKTFQTLFYFYFTDNVSNYVSKIRTLPTLFKLFLLKTFLNHYICITCQRKVTRPFLLKYKI